jgi:hypothetical protein
MNCVDDEMASLQERFFFNARPFTAKTTRTSTAAARVSTSSNKVEKIKNKPGRVVDFSQFFDAERSDRSKWPCFAS